MVSIKVSDCIIRIPFLNDMYIVVASELCHILLDNVPTDDIVKIFSSHKLLTDEDMEVISFAPSEYLKMQFLFQYLQNLKLTMWLMICDILHNTKSMKHIGSQLNDGKLY